MQNSSPTSNLIQILLDSFLGVSRQSMIGMKSFLIQSHHTKILKKNLLVIVIRFYLSLVYVLTFTRDNLDKKSNQTHLNQLGSIV